MRQLCYQLPRDRIGSIDRMWLMVKLLKEAYDNEFTRYGRKYSGTGLTDQQQEECQKAAKKAICQTGLSTYRFTQLFKSHYQRVVENEAIHQAVEKGIENELLGWGEPRSLDFSGKNPELRNIILTEKSYQLFGQYGFELFLASIHSAYIEKIGRKNIHEH
jgi:hypothetical protein